MRESSEVCKRLSKNSFAGSFATEIFDPSITAGSGEVDTLRRQVIDNIHYGDMDANEAAKTFVEGAKKLLEEAEK